MTDAIRRWRRSRRYRVTLRALRGLPPVELARLGISPREVARLAAAVARSL